ncbi:MAG: DNA-protecting protein DprA [Bacteroidales bacterium]|nr:DNA-protecting protein DprA [Bacteroidales bacterium]
MENEEKEKAACMALGNIFGFEPGAGLGLVEAAGSASAVFDLPKDGLHELLGPYNKYSGAIGGAAMEEAMEIIGSFGKGYGYIGCTDPHFPEILRDCPDCPLGLYYRSATDIGKVLNRPNDYISVVGTRDLSPYGEEWTRRIVGAMAGSGSAPTIVSGLAYGVDITAHRTALDKGIPTIGVMATGIDAVYPWHHWNDAERIASTPGCALITDFPPKTQPVKVNFLRRNRIIAGLSKATILVESRSKGGGMVTADLAFSYGREVYALPGRIDDLKSQGCNHLISVKVAEAISDENLLLESLGMGKGSRRKGFDNFMERIRETFEGRLGPESTGLVLRAVSEIRRARSISIEELSRVLDVGYRECSTACSMLESEGFISIDLLQRCTVVRI